MSICFGIQLQGSLNKDPYSYISSLQYEIVVYIAYSVHEAKTKRLPHCLQLRNNICHLKLMESCSIFKMRASHIASTSAAGITSMRWAASTAPFNGAIIAGKNVFNLFDSL